MKFWMVVREGQSSTNQKHTEYIVAEAEAKTLSAACGMDDEDAVKMSKELAEQLLRTSNPLDFVNNVIPTLDTKKKLFVLTHGIRTIAESGTIEMIKESMMNGLGTLAKKFGMDIKDMGEGEE